MASNLLGPALCPICPECRGRMVRPRRTWSSTFLPVALFAASLWLTSVFTEVAAPVGLLLAIALIFLFGLSVAALLSAALGRNRCEGCGTRWR